MARRRWWRRKAALGVSRKPPPDEVLVEDALLVIGAALRLDVKNRLILGSLRDGSGFDADDLRSLLRDRIGALAAEKEAECARLGEMVERARRRRGSAYGPADYRRADVPALERRRRVSELLVARLTELAADDAFVDGQLDLARESALDEIVHPRLAPFREATDADYAAERDERMELVKRDLGTFAETQ